jgi:general stress protein 26
MAELKERIMEVIRQPQLASLATVTEGGKPWVRYVTVTGSDDLALRFSSFLKSRKVAQIRNNPEVHLTCGVTSPESADSYLQIQGRAEVTTDEGERKAYWKEELKRYFSGPEDPNYCIVRIKPYRIEYMAPGSMEPEVWEP